MVLSLSFMFQSASLLMKNPSTFLIYCPRIMSPCSSHQVIVVISDLCDTFVIVLYLLFFLFSFCLLFFLHSFLNSTPTFTVSTLNQLLNQLNSTRHTLKPSQTLTLNQITLLFCLVRPQPQLFLSTC